MSANENDLLSRYKWLSEQCCCVNECLSAVKGCVDRAYAGDPTRKEYVFLVNDLALFLMQIFAFDGFITACLHALNRSKEGSPIERLQRLASCELKEDETYEVLRSSVDEVFKVRDMWVHAQGDPAILKTPPEQGHLADRFGWCEKDGRQWVRLSRQAKDERMVWTFEVHTLHQMAELIWPCVQAGMQNQQQGTT